jgi:hypothetical protein
MPTDEVTYLYSGAVAYADAALLIDADLRSAGRDSLILPTHTLIGLSIEMLFKAIFLHNGGNEKALKGHTVRHNLKELRRLTRDQGFQSAITGVDEIVDHIGDNYAAHEYRYMKPNLVLNKLDVAKAVIAVQHFIDEVAIKTGIPERPSAIV